MRIMVTGSRDWQKPAVIDNALADYDGVHTLVVGDCPSGADRIAKTIAEKRGWDVEVFKADWLNLGRAAGPIRNNQMVLSEPDVCLGFVRNNSRGTTGAMSLATKAGIPVHRFDYGE